MKNTFQIPIITAVEQQRLHALRRYRLFNSEAEKSFTGMARLVGEIFKAEIAMISLVDDEEVSFGANIGMDTTIGPRGESLCSLTVLSTDVNVVEDASKDPNVAKNPLVCGEFGLRFYAGAPLITHDGLMIGSVCIVDVQPRKFSEHERKILQGLAVVIMEQIELRLKNLAEAEQLMLSNEKLTSSEMRFQHILDTMAEGVMIIDQDGNPTYANAMAQQLLGFGRDEVSELAYEDRRWQHQRLDGTPLPLDEHPFVIMLRTAKPQIDYEIALQPPNAEKIYVAVNTVPLIDQNTGKLIGGIGTFTDVTNRRKVLQQKDEFINVASHELKTPVTSLQAAIQLMDRMKDDPKSEIFAKMVNQANRSLEKLTNLIGDLLNANRISQGQLNLRLSTFSIGELTSNCCQHIRTGGKYEIKMEGDMDTEIEADEQQIDQVLVNFVNNAVKYAPESLEITIKAEKIAGELKVSIIDQGPGIPADQLPHLFERYYRADYSGFQFSGLGLGLYICAEIIKKHGGKIGVDSKMGEGSSFWFILPLKQS